MEFPNNSNYSKGTSNDYLTEEYINIILASYGDSESKVENYNICNASDNMLGFLADYWKLKLVVKSNGKKTLHSLFIKAVSKTNAAKADMVKEMKLFDKELLFYSVIKKHLEFPGIDPWSPELVAILNEAMVFQDLNASNYMIRNKFKRFDLPHMFQALNTLARFHVSTLIFEENKSKELRREYRIINEFQNLAHLGGYSCSDPWYKQCMDGALAAIKQFSKHKFNKEELAKISTVWAKVWSMAIDIQNLQSGRSVICHRDLWNNNIMFRYKNNAGTLEPHDCVFVDFQGVRYQSPASDVMVLLYCNLDPSLRHQNMEIFLDYYYQRMEFYLIQNQISIKDIMPRDQFIRSANAQSIWGLVVCACLIPQFWIEDSLSTQIFSDSKKFNEILCLNKSAFIINTMKQNQDYKEKVMEIFDELAEKALLL